MVGKATATLLITLCVATWCYPEGAPAVKSVCEELRPDSSSPHRYRSGSGGYNITTSATLHPNSTQYLSYSAGMEYSVSITTSVNQAEGFLIQAWDPSGARIGTFNPSSGTKQLDCSPYSSIPNTATLTHSRENHEDMITFKWTAPSVGHGMVEFRFTIVAGKFKYYGPFSTAFKNNEAKGVTASSLVLVLAILFASVKF